MHILYTNAPASLDWKRWTTEIAVVGEDSMHNPVRKVAVVDERSGPQRIRYLDVTQFAVNVTELRSMVRENKINLYPNGMTDVYGEKEE